jgi:hypothetical protein
MTQTLVEHIKMYNGEVDMMFYPNSHAYRITDPAYKRVKERMIGNTTVMAVINKPALQEWPMKEALKFMKVFCAEDRPYTQAELLEQFELAAKAYKAKQQRGRSVGTAAHDWIETYFKAMKAGSTLPELPGELTDETDAKGNRLYTDEQIEESKMVRMALSGFLQWVSENDIEVVDVERFVYSRKYGFCGKLDSILKINGKIYIKDAKTSNGSWEFPHGVYPEYFGQLGGYDLGLIEEFPEWDKLIAGHLVLNCSKNNGKFHARYSFDRKMNRQFFLMALGTKRCLQEHTRQLSMKYRENKPKKGTRKK